MRLYRCSDSIGTIKLKFKMQKKNFASAMNVEGFRELKQNSLQTWNFNIFREKCMKCGLDHIFVWQKPTFLQIYALKVCVADKKLPQKLNSVLQTFLNLKEIPTTNFGIYTISSSNVTFLSPSPLIFQESLLSLTLSCLKFFWILISLKYR